LTAGRIRKPEERGQPRDQSVVDRPTVPPPFDPADYARQSERELRAASSRPDPSGVRIAKVQLRSRPLSVLMLDSDMVGRSPIVRGLLRSQCSVTAVETVDTLDEALAGPVRFDVIIVSVNTRDLAQQMETVLAVEPDLPIVALAADESEAATAMTSAGVHRFTTCRREASTADLLSALHELVRDG
jgi:CheY-like chemotaxis protein